MISALARFQRPLAVLCAIGAGVAYFAGMPVLAGLLVNAAAGLGVPRPSELANATQAALEAARALTPQGAPKDAP